MSTDEAHFKKSKKKKPNQSQSTKLKNLKKRDDFLYAYDLPKLTHVELNNFTRPCADKFMSA